MRKERNKNSHYIQKCTSQTHQSLSHSLASNFQLWHDPWILTLLLKLRLRNSYCLNNLRYTEMFPQLQQINKHYSSFNFRLALVKLLKLFGKNKAKALSLIGSIDPKIEISKTDIIQLSYFEIHKQLQLYWLLTLL